MKTILTILILFINFNIIAQIDFVKHKIAPNFPNVDNLLSCDIDNDGDVDILGKTDNSIIWFENTDGNGNFYDYTVLISGYEVIFAFACEDIDLDGDIDIAISHGILSAGCYDNYISWNKNNGDGTFSNPILISEIPFGVSQIIFADIDMDNKNDLVYLGSSCGYTRIAWHNNIYGTFGYQNLVLYDTIPISIIAVNEINNDNNNDIIYGGENGEIYWIDNTSNHDFINKHEIFTGNDKIISLDVEDINGDSLVDIIWFERYTTEIKASINNDTIFSADTILLHENSSITCSKVFDIDNDNDCDIIYFLTDTIKWLENTGNNFEPNLVLCENSQTTLAYTINDLDGDNIFDIVTLNANPPNFDNYSDIGWYKHIDGNGEFSNRTYITMYNQGNFCIYSCDLDNDNDSDIIAYNSNYKQILFYENIDGQGNFPTQKVIINLPNTSKNLNKSFQGSAFRRLIVEDYNNDGFDDIIYAEHQQIYFYKNKGVNMEFEQQQLLFETTNSGLYTDLIIFPANINNDNFTDIIARQIGGSYTYILINNGDNTFNMTDNIHTSGYFSLVSCGVFVSINDIDNDGYNDIILNDNNGVYWYQNIDGTGDFSNSNLISLEQEGSFSIYAEDFNNDNNIDILAVSNDEVGLYKNLGNSIFAEKEIIYTTTSSMLFMDVLLSDFDNDEDIDIIVSREVEGSIDDIFDLLLNNSDAEFEVENVINKEYCTLMLFSDINNDGIIDIISNNIDNELFWLETPVIIGIKDIKKNYNFNIHPNPSTGQITIESEKTIEQVKITDINGRTVKQITNNKDQITIDLSNEAKGVYFVKLINESGVSTQKIVLE